MITLPRRLLIALGAAFSLFSIVVAVSTLPIVPQPALTLAALLLYVVATGLSVWLGGTSTLPSWLAVGNVAVTVAMTLLVSSMLDPGVDNGYGTWYVGAAGTLLTITAVRHHGGYAWYGVGLLAAHTLIWTGSPAAVLQLGVGEDVAWIAAAYILGRTLVRATRDVQQFARAEREAVEWRAMQDAHHFERQARLVQTSRMALPMLERIRDAGGVLGPAERHEAEVLEQGIRDEIRGRRLLNGAVRDAVTAARRGGAEVLVLDDGGVDNIDPRDLDPVLDRVAEALTSTTADRWIIRTAPKITDKAVTVVGITLGDPDARALGLEDDESESVDVWLELDRPVHARRSTAVPAAAAR